MSLHPVFIILLALLSAPAAAHAQPNATVPIETPADAAFYAQLRAALLRHPEVLSEAFDQLQVQQEAQKAAGARDAIVAHRNALEHDPKDPVLGNPAGKVTVVEFFDYRCPYCRAFNPTLDAILAANPDVRLVLKVLTFLDAEDGSHISEDAARAALAAKAQGRFATVHHAFLARTDLDEGAITKTLKAAGVTIASAKPVETSSATTAALDDVRALAHSLGIQGTPGFVIGDQLIDSADADALRRAIIVARDSNSVRP